MIVHAKDKTCYKCKQAMNVSMFYGDKSRKDGLRHSCKACDINHSRIWRSKNSDTVLESAKKWNSDNKERHISNVLSWRDKNKSKQAGYNRKYDLKKNYGI